MQLKLPEMLYLSVMNASDMGRFETCLFYPVVSLNVYIMQIGNWKLQAGYKLKLLFTMSPYNLYYCLLVFQMKMICKDW